MSGFRIAEAFVSVKADATGLRGEVDRAVKEAGAGQEVKVGLKVDKGSLGGLAANLAPFILPTIAAVGQLSGVLGLVPAVAGAAGLAYGTLKVGLAGVGEAFKGNAKLGDLASKVAEGNARALTGQEGAAKAAASAQKSYNKELVAYEATLTGLAPSARELVLQTLELGPAWASVKLDVQQRLFEGLGAEVRKVGTADLPVLRSGLVAMAGSLNLAARYTGDWLASARTTSDVKTIFDNSSVAGQNLARAIQPILGIIRDVGTVGSQFLPQLSSGFATSAQKAADFVSKARDTGKMHEWIQTGINAFGSLWQVVKNIVGIFIQIANAPGFSPNVISGLAAVTGWILQLLKSAPQLIPIIEGVLVAWRAWAIAQWALNAAMDANPIVLVVALIAGLVAAVIIATGHSKAFMDALIRLWDGIKSAVLPVLTELWDKIQKQIIPAFEAFVLAMGPIVDFCVRTLAPVVKATWDAVRATISGAVTIITGILQAWTGLLTGNWNQFWAGIQTILRGAWQIIQSVIGAALNLVLGLFGTSTTQISASWNNFWNSVRNTASSVWNSISGFLTGALNSFRGFWGGVWNGVVGDFQNIWGRITGIASGIWNNVTGAFRAGVNSVVNLINGLVNDVDQVLGFLHIALLPRVPLLAAGGVVGLAGGGTVGKGFTTNGPTAIVGEGNRSHPEYVIPTDPAHRVNALSLYQSLGTKLMAGGGILSSVEGWVSDNVIGGAVDKLASVIPAGMFHDIAAGVGHRVVDAVKTLISQAQTAFSAAFTGSPDLAGWIQTALGLTGTPGTWAGPLSVLIGRESGGNPNAINRTDSNAQAGHPSQGLMQTIPSTFSAYHQAGTSWNILDPVANIAAGINYIKARYGSVFNVQQANPNLPPRGYDAGGLLPTGLSLVRNSTGQPERVLNATQTAKLDRLLAGRGGMGSVTVNVTQVAGSPAETGRYVALALRTVA